MENSFFFYQCLAAGIQIFFELGPLCVSVNFRPTNFLLEPGAHGTHPEQRRNERLEHPLNEIGPGWGQTVDDLPRALVVATDADPEAGLPARPVAARNPAVGARKHFSCAFVYGPGAGCVMQTESLTEKRLALVLLARPDIVALETQVVFTWDAEDGSQRRHYFDFRATKTDGSRVAIMVKYDRKLSREEFRAQIADIAAHVTPDFADRVTLMTERHLDPVDLHNATLFNAVRKPDPEADAVMRDTAWHS